MIRLRLQIQGVVQGVGFRPVVWRLAHELQLVGFVRNDSAGVTIEIQGDRSKLQQFCESLPRHLPDSAHIDSLRSEPLDCGTESDFVILPSRAGGQGALIPPDLATCEECLRELQDPADRRYRYPFLNCTACGPRYTIVESLPYDRSRTTMRSFPLCPECRAEYQDPRDRRFHAQPVACPACGPQLSMPLEEILSRLAEGQILALKGIGGYHLVCRPESEARLREKKRRPHQPLARMVKAPRLPPELRAVLESPARPILIHDGVGIMLPYSALHHLICEDALLVTSANASGEPIAREADSRLADLCDAVVHHDRPIAVACDDSVVQWSARGALPLRRSRGYVPNPVNVALDTVPTLAVGGELKSTLAITRGSQVYLSGHIGDVANLETLQRLEENAIHLERLLDVKLQRVVADMHPAYLSHSWARRFAQARGLPFLAVQHHHAHLASLLGEHMWPVDRPVLAFILDGTGWGPDGAIWGGEVLLGNYAGFQRVAHLEYLPLRGGDAAVRNPARLALEYLQACEIPLDPRLPCVAAASELELRNVGRGPAVPTSSAGRLFDAVSALLGVCARTTYEGQAALELERACLASDEGLDFPLGEGLIRCRPALDELSRAVMQGVPAGILATRFHNGLADMIVQASRRWGQGRTIALSGGCFQNVRLLEATLQRLEAAGFEVLIHNLVPCNDGGLALGQALLAQGEGLCA